MRIIEWFREKKRAFQANRQCKKHGENVQSAEKQPLVFANQPINDSEHDIVGFSSQVDTICEAISHGSTMVCITADYGTGKSSLTKLLSKSVTKKPLRYPRPIEINMWDCLLEGAGSNEGSSAGSQKVSNLTRSFLYQLACGNDKHRHFSSYINKRLSRNYGNFSLSTGSRKFWCFFAFAAIFYTLYSIFSNGDIELDKVVSEEKPREVLGIVRALSPGLLFIAGVLLILGIVHTCVVFSHWKAQSARETEVNDVFDVYAQIIDHIKPRQGKKQLIIVEDLDRVVEKSVIIGFLKELYRFQSSMRRYADRFVFVVSIKPEAVLTDQAQQLMLDDDHVYTKLFDLIVPLKPIHYDDHDSLLLELFRRDPEAKRRLETLTGEKIGPTVLPRSFEWIKRGKNLTLRDLKDRLNHAAMIMLMTTQRRYQVKTAVTFEACAAVTYLESQYPAEYYKLIRDEQAFAGLMSNSVNILNDSKDVTAVMKGLRDEFHRQFPDTFGADFVNDICALICDGVFNYDFRMYFYTYPSGSHIKTTEERELCDMLLLPAKFHDFSRLDKIVDAVYASNNTDENNIVTATIKGLDTYPEVVLMNKTLLRVACEHNWQEAAAAANRVIIKPMAFDEYAVNFWARVHEVEFPAKHDFVETLITYLIASFTLPKDIALTRGYIIRGYGKDILTFKRLFFKRNADVIPQISAEELSLIEDISIAIELIDPDNLAAEQFGYLSDRLCREPLSDACFNQALAIMHQYDFIRPEGYAAAALRFLTINHCLDSILFHAACIDYDTDALLAYLNSFDPELLPDAYYADIDDIEDRAFAYGLRFGILEELAMRDHYRCVLLAASEPGNISVLDGLVLEPEDILEDCRWLCEHDMKSFVAIRWHLCILICVTGFSVYVENPSDMVVEGRIK